MQGHLGPRDLCLNKLGKGPLGMHLHTKFQASEQSRPEEEDFLNIFQRISMVRN